MWDSGDLINAKCDGLPGAVGAECLSSVRGLALTLGPLDVYQCEGDEKSIPKPIFFIHHILICSSVLRAGTHEM